MSKVFTLTLLKLPRVVVQRMLGKICSTVEPYIFMNRSFIFINLFLLPSLPLKIYILCPREKLRSEPSIIKIHQLFNTYNMSRHFVDLLACLITQCSRHYYKEL